MDKFEEYKNSVIKCVEDNFELNPFNLIDEFIDISDTGLFNINVDFILEISNRTNYPKNANIEKHNGKYYNYILSSKGHLDFEYGLCYSGYPYINKSDIEERLILVNIIVKYQNPVRGEYLHFLPMFKSIISRILNRYSLEIKNEKNTLDMQGYVSYTVYLISL